MKVIIDTNLWISFLIGKKLSAMRALFTNPKIQIYVCDELLDEFNTVTSRLKIRKYINNNDILDTYRLMEPYCYYASIAKKAFSVIRDKKDLYLLSFAETITADSLLTGDFDKIFKISRMNALSKYSSFGGFRGGFPEGFGKAFSEGQIYIREKIKLYTAKVNLYTYENKFIHCENKFTYVRKFTYIRTEMG